MRLLRQHKLHQGRIDRNIWAGFEANQQLCIWMSRSIKSRGNNRGEEANGMMSYDYKACGQTLFLPGQMEVQSPFWTLEPGQVRPPLSGVGFVHNRVRFWVPRPQEFGCPVDVHSDHEDQDDQPPLTVSPKEQEQNNNMIKMIDLASNIWSIEFDIRSKSGREFSEGQKTILADLCQQPVGPCSSIDLEHVFILCIDFKRWSKDDSDSGRMEEFRIKAAHTKRKNWKELWKEKIRLFSLR
jgi:hypothetical protein